MTRHVLTASPTTELAEAMALMVDGHFRHLPVVNGEGQVIGLVSMRDLMTYTSMRLRGGSAGQRRRPGSGRDDRHDPPHAHGRSLAAGSGFSLTPLGLQPTPGSTRRGQCKKPDPSSGQSQSGREAAQGHGVWL